MAYTFDEKIVSDLHKDARGFRPTEAFWNAWNFQNDEGKQTAWNVLLDELSETIDRERAEQAAALASFEKRINDTIALGARDVKTALKWIFEAEQFDDFDLRYGPDYVAFHFNLNYGDVRKFPIQEVINEMLSEVV